MVVETVINGAGIGSIYCTFYYDDQISSRNPSGSYDVWPLTTGAVSEWQKITDNSAAHRAWNDRAYFEKVKFDPSIANWSGPTDCEQWFDTFKGETIEGLEYLNTSNVTNMQGMFANCPNIKTLDLSNFNTAKVTDMSSMFYGDSKLTTIKLSNNFKVNNVTTMWEMFSGCKFLNTIENLPSVFSPDQLTTVADMFSGCGLVSTQYFPILLEQIVNKAIRNSNFKEDGIAGLFRACTPSTIDISKLNLTGSHITSLQDLFLGCWNLTTIVGIDKLDTKSIVDMSGMFAGCRSLETLDLSSFIIKNGVNIEEMFSGCSKLTTILVQNDQWQPDKLTGSSVFSGCDRLVGGNGTSYSSSAQGKEYARIDGDGGDGYFTAAPASAYASIENSGTKMVFYYDNKRNTHETTYEVKNQQFPTWHPSGGGDGFPGKKDITEVVFDQSFANYSPKTCNLWFDSFKKLKTISGIENLNTQDVTSMHAMFYYCEALEAIDLSGCDTRNVTDMSTMFGFCENLKSINLTGKFNTSKVTNIADMFEFCAFTELDLSNFNFSSITNGDSFIYFCAQLRIIKFGEGFKPYENMRWWLMGSSSLETVLVENDKWDVSVISNATQLFGNNTLNLVGGNGTKWESANTSNAEYLRIDRDNAPGYLTKLPYSIKCIDPDDNNKELSVDTYLPYDASISFFKNNPQTKIQLPEPTKEGYDFAGWVDGANTGLTSATKNVEINPATDRYNRVYKATWTPKEYTITFKTQYEDVIKLNIDPITAPYTANISNMKPADPTYNGFKFIGWSPEYPTEMPLGGIELTAQWEIINYTITLDYDGGKLPDGKTNPTTYTVEDVFTFEEPIRTDYVFNGWYSVNDKKVIAAIEHSTGDISLVAQWLPRITAEVEGTFNFPSDQNKFCDGSEKSVSVTYTIIRGDATDYTLTFEGNAIPEIKGKADGNPIVINIPEDLWSGVYKGSLVFTDANNVYGESIDYPISITANIPRPAAVQLYTDMLLADNHEGNFASYQWYKDGNAISGATFGYYYEETLSGKYTVKITTTDGKEFMSCPVKLVTAKAQKQSVKVYPNPAKKGEVITIEIENYTDGGDYTIKIFSSNGSLVKQLTAVSKTTQIALPSGIYSGSLINGGEKSGFKLIVK